MSREQEPESPEAERNARGHLELEEKEPGRYRGKGLLCYHYTEEKRNFPVLLFRDTQIVCLSTPEDVFCFLSPREAAGRYC